MFVLNFSFWLLKSILFLVVVQVVKWCGFVAGCLATLSPPCSLALPALALL